MLTVMSQFGTFIDISILWSLSMGMVHYLFNSSYDHVRIVIVCILIKGVNSEKRGRFDIM
jgi:hypothetical protein